jgi:rhodanese-related sulfurtransferase
MNDPLASLSVPFGPFREVGVDAAAPHVGAVHVVDVREVPEFNDELGHISNAEHVPLATVPVAAVSWDREAPVLVVCRSGGRSARAAVALSQMGFQRVYNLAGGMLAWRAGGLPVARH